MVVVGIVVVGVVVIVVVVVVVVVDVVVDGLEVSAGQQSSSAQSSTHSCCSGQNSLPSAQIFSEKSGQKQKNGEQHSSDSYMLTVSAQSSEQSIFPEGVVVGDVVDVDVVVVGGAVEDGIGVVVSTPHEGTSSSHLQPVFKRNKI